MYSNFIQGAAQWTGLSITDIKRLIQNAPRRYKTYEIPKRSGGTRVIAQPARELKDLQYYLIHVLLSKFPIHDAATAYRLGRSIRSNAAAHVGNAALLKMDFRDFFGSIRSSDFDKLCVDNGIGLSAEDLYFCHQVLFWQQNRVAPLKLSIGAPSSPILSNIMMFRFDEAVSNLCLKRNIIYSRYADDITFSSQELSALLEIEKLMPKILAQLRYPVIYINPEKTVIATKAGRRTVTGLVLTNDGKVSVGRDRKRELRAAFHSFINGALSVEDREILRGHLAFVNSVEPEFIERLGNKYGYEHLSRLFRTPPVSRRQAVTE